MDSRLLNLCNKEMKELLQKNLIRPSSSPWYWAAFYVKQYSQLSA